MTASDLVGETIDERFEVERKIAAGGMGRIFHARDVQTGRPVAIKVMQVGEDIAVARFRREAALLAEVRHPGVVEYVTHGTIDGNELYIAMEWLEGVDLAHRLASVDLAHRLAGARSDITATLPVRTSAVGPLASSDRDEPADLPVADVVALGRRLASALGEVHRRGIVHRDLKPSNIFLVDGDLSRAKLIDFGIAREAATARPLTASGVMVGTPYYMAPEQVRAGEMGPPVDVWGLGCVLYECLTGRGPFAAAHPLGALARIIIEDPPSIAGLRPDCPAALAAIIHGCLAKDPAARPASGDAVAALLVAIEPGQDTGDLVRAVPRAAPRLTTSETRVTSLLFARVASAAQVETVRAIASPHGERVESLADDGTLLISGASGSSPKDRAARSARIAIAVRAALPVTALAIATGRVGDRSSVGEVVDRAVSALLCGAQGEIVVDRWTVGLLEGRFELRGESGRQVLEREHVDQTGRTLLGRPSRWVGRRRELTTLMATFDECVEDQVARVVLVTAAPGIGKSRLCHEFLRGLAGRDVEILQGHGDSLSAGSPFGMIAPAIRRSAGILDGEHAGTRAAKLRERVARAVGHERLGRVTGLLGQLVGVALDDLDDDALRAARSDPMLMGELMRSAWEEWLRAECAVRPVLLVLEDLHWGDLPSVTYVDAALRALAAQPLMVLALARPEVHAQFPRMWESRDVQEVRLAPLAARACGELVAGALGARASAALAAQLIERSEGNAFYLEELIRAVADGATDALPGSVIGMVQARLDALDLEARRVLRAAAVFGEVFWDGGVCALLGDGGGAFDVREWLVDLERREVIASRNGSRVPGEREYKFRHALVRDAAYEMLTDADRALGHNLAGAWLERAGEIDALVLAAHYERGGEAARAVHWLGRAAAEALEGNDLAAVIECGERARAAGAAGDELGAIRALQSIAAYWRNAYEDSRRFGGEALTLVAAGTSDWFKAAGSALVSCARLGDLATFDRIFERAFATLAAAGARAAQLVCLCRGTFQLVFNGRFARADEVLAEITRLAEAAPIDALTRAQVEHVQGVRAAYVGDVRTFLRHVEAAVEAFDRAGDVRNASLERTTIAWCWAEIGDVDRAAALCRASLAHCLRLGAPQAVTHARVNLGFILGLRSHWLDEAMTELRAAIAECRAVGNQRLEGWATAHLAAAYRERGDAAESRTLAAAASALLTSAPGLCAWAQALEALALVEQGRADLALPLARAAMAVLERIGGLLQGESLPPLALALALSAMGDVAEERRAIADAIARIERRAARLQDAGWIAQFRALPDNTRTLALAKRVR